MGSPSEVRSVLEDFVDDLNSDVDTHRLEELLRGDGTLSDGEVGTIESKPESWTRHHLIRRLFEAVDFEWENEIHGKGEGYPDFGIINLDVVVIGEDKSINKIEEAQDDIEEYLNNRAASRNAEYGIATDGIEWRTRRIELGGDYLDYDEVEDDIDFRDCLLQIARDKNYIGQTGLDDTDIEETVDKFYNTYSIDQFNPLLTQETPRKIRESKKAGVEEFYDLYVELLFGEGSENYEYNTTLLNDVRAPDGITDTDRRKFAIKLVNRLLFVKFLEDRGVLPEDFLRQRVDNYQQVKEEVDEFSGGLYKSQIEPLFFSLFNTEETDRISKHRGSWLDEVP